MTQLTPNHRPDTPPTEDFTREEVRLRRYFLRQQVPVPDADRELEQLYRKRRSQLVRRTAVWGSVAALIALAVWLVPSLVGRQAQQVVHTAPAVDAVTLQTSRGERLTIGSADDDDALHTLGATLDDGGSRLAYDDRSATPVQMQVLSTPARRTFHVTLADGTEVWLNAESQLVYPETFAGDERRVAVSGEAYFKVAKDSLRPFYVETGGMEVRVYGTEFNIQAYGDDAHVYTTLVKGSIALKPLRGSGGELVLTPGHQAVSRTDDQATFVRPVNAAAVASWHEGRFSFEEQTLGQIMQTLSRWYAFEYEFADPSLESTVFKGSAPRYGDLAEVLSILEKSGGIAFGVKGEKIIITNHQIK